MADPPPESATKRVLKQLFELRSWLFLALGMLIGGGITVALMHWLSGYTVADGFGQLLSGIATCVGVMGAGIAYRSWEATHRKTKLSEVAAEVLVTSVDLCAVMRRVARFYLSASADDGGRQKLASALKNPALFDRAYNARISAEALMSDDAKCSELLRKLWDRRTNLQGMIDLDLMGFSAEAVVPEPPPEDEPGYALFGDDGRRQIDAILKEIKEHFRDYAIPK